MTTPVNNNPTSTAAMLNQLQGGTRLTSSELTSLGVSTGVQSMLSSLPPAEQISVESAFLEMAPSSGVYQAPPGAVDASIQRLVAANNVVMGAISSNWLLDGTGLSVDDLSALLAKLEVKAMNQEEQSAESQVLAQHQQAEADDMQQGVQLNKEASTMESGAAVQLACTVVGSAISLGMAGYSMKLSGGAETELNGLKVPEAPGEGEDVDEGGGGQIHGADPELEISEPSETPSGQKVQGERQVDGEEEDEDQNKQVNKEDEKLKAQNKFQEENAKFDLKQKQIQSVQTKAQTMQGLGQTLDNLFQGFGSFASTTAQAQGKADEATGDFFAAQGQQASAQADEANQVLQKVDQLVPQLIQFLQTVESHQADLGSKITDH
jgi:hypothetical protein